jgi:hypothetical protein
MVHPDSLDDLAHHAPLEAAADDLDFWKLGHGS